MKFYLGLTLAVAIGLSPMESFAQANRAGGILACEANLDSCNGDLGSCEGSLGACEDSLGICIGDFSNCTSDLTATGNALSACEGDLGTCNSSLNTCDTNLDACESDLDAAMSVDVCDLLPVDTGIETDLYVPAGLIIHSLNINGQGQPNWGFVPDELVEVSIEWDSPPMTHCPGCITYNEVYLAPTNGPVQLLGCFGPGIQTGLINGGSYSNGRGASGSVQFMLDLSAAESSTYRLAVRKSWVYRCGQYIPSISYVESRPLHVFCIDH